MMRGHDARLASPRLVSPPSLALFPKYVRDRW
ncbi:hypothetical protein E2C01_101834 [Portunus trituberculatus]|uniref:Uncharacterized protein n=1 Tax=Portunus trituberculatus TaxID=210409 RepID=A0A5B7KGV0_PORTR|nr:hypothetical protein [Portunus trituberculatus]